MTKAVRLDEWVLNIFLVGMFTIVCSVLMRVSYSLLRMMRKNLFGFFGSCLYVYLRRIPKFDVRI